ncbi:hypothetical protein ACFWVC_35410, partial [Streptomyces sp. NPDC058691]
TRRHRRSACKRTLGRVRHPLLRPADRHRFRGRHRRRHLDRAGRPAGKTLLAPALGNFREQDFHWASAILVPEKQKVTDTVACRKPGTPPDTTPAPTACDAAALISRTLE